MTTVVETSSFAHQKRNLNEIRLRNTESFRHNKRFSVFKFAYRYRTQEIIQK